VGSPEEVAGYLTAGNGRPGGRRVDYYRLRSVVRTAVHFLDNVIEMNRYPLEQIREVTLANRKIGLGVMGFADLLALLGIPYDSEDALRAAGELMGFINREAINMSEELARTRGACPNFVESVFPGKACPHRRNATVTTIAPTGTISIIAECSSGIEPFFAIVYTRNVMDNDKLGDINPVFLQIAREEGFYSEELIEEISQRESVRGISRIPEEWQRVFVTAHDVSPEWHIRMQAAFQQHTENAVSKTVNFPRHATQEDVARVYLAAFKLGCKGVTVYRDGSRENQVLTRGISPAREETEPEAAVGPEVEDLTAEPVGAREVAVRGLTPRPRPEIIRGQTRRMTTGCGNLYITINEDDIGLFEVFTTMGKAGGCAASQAEAISRLISLALRAGVDTESIIRQLHSVRCPAPAWEKGGGMILSCADAIAKAIERYLKDQEEKSKAAGPPAKSVPAAAAGAPAVSQGLSLSSESISSLDIRVCPDCGGQMESESGCFFCRACGFSRCE